PAVPSFATPRRDSRRAAEGRRGRDTLRLRPDRDRLGRGRGRLHGRARLELAGEPFDAPHSKLAAPVRLRDGTEAVLKVANEDDWEGDREPEALRFWGGVGAVRLIDHDPETRSMLIERCLPGTPLGTDYNLRALEVAADLLRRLWRPPP